MIAIAGYALWRAQPVWRELIHQRSEPRGAEPVEDATEPGAVVPGTVLRAVPPLKEPPEAKDARDLKVHPMFDLDGMTKAEVYKQRQKFVALEAWLAPKNYVPSEAVFGQIEDRKPWWGMEGMYFWGDGDQATEGPSKESRSVGNPYMLFSVYEVWAYRAFPRGIVPGKEGDRYYPFPERLSWNPEKHWARVIYDIGSHFKYLETNEYSRAEEHAFEIMAYNARDFGYSFTALRKAESSGAKLPQLPGNHAVQLQHFIHLGTSCGRPEGCNNSSPTQVNLMGNVEALPARLVFSLWRARPASAQQTPDFTYVIDLR